MGWCCIRTCRNRSSRKTSQQIEKENENGRTLNFFKFSTNANKRGKWVHAVRWINGSDWSPTPHATICCEHFIRENIYTDKNRKVRTTKDAYPAIFKSPSTTEPKESFHQDTLKQQPVRKPPILGGKRKALTSLPNEVNTAEKKIKLEVIDATEVEPNVYLLPPQVNVAELLSSSITSALSIFLPCKSPFEEESASTPLNVDIASRPGATLDKDSRLDSLVPQKDKPVRILPKLNIQSLNVNTSNVVPSAISTLNASAILSPPTFKGVHTSTPQNVRMNSTLGVTFDRGATLDKSLPQLNVHTPTPSSSNDLTSLSTVINTTSTFHDVPESSSSHSSSNSVFKRASLHSSPELQTSSSTENNDFFNFDVDTPRKVKLKKELSRQQERIDRLRKKLKLVNQSHRRDKIKIKNMELVIKNLKSTPLVSEEEFKCIKDLGKTTELLMVRQIQKARGLKVTRDYEPELRAFACTLHYYSPRAYEFVRTKVNNCLPHCKTITRWYMGIDGKPGFTSESFIALTAKAIASKYPLFAALSVDEVNIRQKVEKNFVGYVDLGEGTGVKSKDREIATQALVFMLVGINGSWKIPIGYFLINSLKNDEKAALITKSLSLTHKTGIRVKSLTCDGTAVNLSTVKRLGCDFTLDNMVTWFPHPDNPKEKIHVFLDPSHMLKLVRNTLGDWYRFYDSSGGKILWQYLPELHKLQELEGLRMANKITSQHIHFHRKKMNVRLAAQLLSSSSAKALHVCTELGLEEFKGSEPLQKFLENFDKLFDILNSKSLYGTGFKKALCTDNKDDIFAFFKEMTAYIKGLYLDALDPKNSTLLNSDRFTGFLGFIVCMKSAQGLYEDLCDQEDSTLHYLPLYKISQDHLELFFGLIRARGGWNNNPSALHFQGSYKRCLVHLELRNERSGNCFPLENITILYCTKAAKNPDKLINLTAKSTSDDVMKQDTSEEVRFKEFNIDAAVFDHFNTLNDHLYALDPETLTIFARNVVTYIAGFVVKTLEKSLKCRTCVLALTHLPVTEHRLLLDAKDKGGLTVPGQDVVRIAESCEQIVRIVIHQYDNNLISKNNNALKLTNELMATYALPENNKTVFRQLDEHVLEQDPLNNHKYLLIKSIALRYFNTRLNHIVREMVNKVDSVRHYYNKLVLFNGH